MMNISNNDVDIWLLNRKELSTCVSCLLNVDAFVIDEFDSDVGISRENFHIFTDCLVEIRSSPVSIYCQPAACSAESPITGVALPEDQYLLRISPEGRCILIQGLSAALRNVADWEFSMLTFCNKEYVQGLIDILQAAPEKE